MSKFVRQSCELILRVLVHFNRFSEHIKTLLLNSNAAKSSNTSSANKKKKSDSSFEAKLNTVASDSDDADFIWLFKGSHLLVILSVIILY
jgi:hypothetical protein